MLGTASSSESFLDLLEGNNEDPLMPVNTTNQVQMVVPGACLPIAPKEAEFTNIAEQLFQEDEALPLKETVMQMRFRLYVRGQKKQECDDPPSDSTIIRQWRKEIKAAYSGFNGSAKV